MEKQVVILAGGKSERFGGKVPKPFVRIWGKQMGEFLGDSLRANVKNVYWICGPMLNNYDVLGEVTRWWKGGHHEICFLKYQTRNSVESLYLGIQYFLKEKLMNDQLPILVLDNDNYYDASVLRFFEPNLFDAASAAVLTRPVKSSDTEKYGFLKVEHDTVLDVKEKKRGWGETHISLGGYGFSSATYLLSTLSKTSSTSLLEALYTKHTPILSIETSSTYSIGTPEDLRDAEALCPEKFSWKNTRIVVDLDNTLVSYPRVHGEYRSCEFRKDILDWLRFVKDKGAKLILSTARRSETHGGNQGKIIADVGLTVLQQAAASGIVWDEILFGKAYGDIYLDDRGYNPNFDLWQTEVGDFHLHTGLNEDTFESILDSSKHNIRKEKMDIIVKKGSFQQVNGYRYYLESIQHYDAIKHYFPKLFFYEQKADTSCELIIQYIRGIEASVLLSNGSMRETEWKAIFRFLETLHSQTVPGQGWTKEELEHQWIGKTLERMEVYKENYSDEFVQEILKKVHAKLVEYIELRSNSLPSNLIHGDAWLSNLLFNEKNQLFAIDMRGKTSKNELRLTGDSMYDYAKLGTSILGMDAAVFGLKELEKSIKLQHWNVLVENTPSEYREFLPSLVFSLAITALWNYKEDVRKNIIRFLKVFSFLLD